MSEPLSSAPPVPGASPSPAPRTSGLAVASLILSILVVPPLPIVGLVLGIVALSKISSSMGVVGGKGLAIAGIAVGSITTFLGCMVLLSAMMLPALSAARDQARAVACRSNMKQIALGVGMYQTDYKEEMPPDFFTLLDLGYVHGVFLFECPASRDDAPGGNALIESWDLDATSSYHYARLHSPDKWTRPSDMPIFYDKKTFHNTNAVNVAFADLHVAFTSLDELERMFSDHAGLYVNPPEMPTPPD